MANNYPANHGGRRNGAEHVAQIAAEYNQQLDSLVEALLQLIRERHGFAGPTNIIDAPIIMLICVAIKIVRQKLLSEIARQDMDIRFRLAYALIALTLGCVVCSLLMHILLDEIPWLIDFPWVLLLVILFAFIANERIN
ncbi:uncharacterized protein LOC130138328 [Syzygium oleosum]|uniref:uncharacterized protein LOC130138328 n=1 Tax=Syzygium oleosum TaxID=219896 RepID=UPI0024BBD42A|nr:uncharacterized protein LOC130138328 [Syzygium oleosum]